jgi:hypothetical protein
VAELLEPAEPELVDEHPAIRLAARPTAAAAVSARRERCRAVVTFPP